MLLFIKKHTDTFIEQKKTRPQKTLEFKKNEQMQSFSFSPPLNLIDEGKWLLGVTSLECTNSVFNISDDNNSFPITITGHWKTKSADETIDELNKFSMLRLY